MRSKEFYKRQFGSWYQSLAPVVVSERFDKLIDKAMIDIDINGHAPRRKQSLFYPFRACPFNELKVVIIGGEVNNSEEYNGLGISEPDCFSFSHRFAKIWADVEDEFHDGLLLHPDFTLEDWARQGVLLLNNSFTYSARNEEKCHEMWNAFMRVIISKLAYRDVPVLLWGENALIFIPTLEKYNIKYITAEEPVLGEEWNFSFRDLSRIMNRKINW